MNGDGNTHIHTWVYKIHSRLICNLSRQIVYLYQLLFTIINICHIDCKKKISSNFSTIDINMENLIYYILFFVK
jgi:hypothetical protein